ncbi:MAG TPA: BREX protein BrxB domain-containing protein, partial [Thermomicrobiales bacterium]|nr:BREX protein BrxB domain-containing protein [Thermomicrobiales bacterium]
MSAMDDLLAAYEARLKLPWDQSLAGAQRIWFVVYDPALERRLRLHLGDFENATAQAGHGWRRIDLTDAFADWMAAHKRRDAYFREPDKAKYALDQFASALKERLLSAVNDAGANDVVAVSGVAALFGLVRVSPLIGAVAGSVRGRLVVFFPGQYDERSYFRLLDARDGWDYLAVPITAGHPS